MSELPASMQTCFSYGGTCWGSSVISPPMPGAPASLISSYDLPNMSAFQYTDGTTDKWLLRYTLATPSQENGTPLTGHAWMSVNQNYDLSLATYPELTPFSVYLDRTPPAFYYQSPSGPISSNFVQTLLSADGLLTGNGYGQGDYLSYQGNASFGGAFSWFNVPELYTSGVLNLLYLQYQPTDGGIASLTFNPTDNRNLLFDLHYSYSDPYLNVNSHTTYYVASTPIPAGIWLFISGLMGLGVLSRKKKIQLIH